MKAFLKRAEAISRMRNTDSDVLRMQDLKGNVINIS
jgi:hypothetical protein